MTALRAIDAVPVSANVIETLEKALAAARNGEISQCAIATIGRDGTSSNTWSFLHSTALMLGSIEILKHWMIQKWDDA